MAIERALKHRERLAALISAGTGISEIKRVLGFNYAALYDMIRLLRLPRPVDQRTRRPRRAP